MHLIRGNHEAHDINALFGFRLECLERLGDDQVGQKRRIWRAILAWSVLHPSLISSEDVPDDSLGALLKPAHLQDVEGTSTDIKKPHFGPPLGLINQGVWVWRRINDLFNYLPLAASIEGKILCMHGGIGRSIHKVEQISAIPRPVTMEDGGPVLMDLLWSDPTTNDAVTGVQPSPRGPGLVTFGPDRVKDFCKVGVSAGGGRAVDAALLRMGWFWTTSGLSDFRFFSGSSSLTRLSLRVPLDADRTTGSR